MLTEKQAAEILQALKTLPPEKVVEARDFILFLQAHYGQQQVDESEAGTDADLHALSAESLKEFENDLDALAEGLEYLSLQYQGSYTRADIYADHD